MVLILPLGTRLVALQVLQEQRTSMFAPCSIPVYLSWRDSPNIEPIGIYKTGPCSCKNHRHTDILANSYFLTAAKFQN